MTSSPLISICVPNLNKRAFLEERMETLLAQTFTNWEMIVCDSYSEDGSWEFLQKFKNEPRIRLFQVPRAGLYAGWNECLQRARGEYINIATSDDTASSELLEKLVEPLERRRDLHVSVCDFQEIDENSHPTSVQLVRFREFLGKWLNIPHIRSGKTEFLANTVFIATWYTMAAVLFRRSLLEKTGLFRTDQKSFADTDWTLRASLATDIAYVPGRWTTFRLSSDQATPKTNTPDRWRIYVESLSRILDEPGSQIQSQWKQIAGWRERLLRYRKNWYLDSFQLYRWAAKENPARFIGSLAEAALREPGYFLNQSLRAFPARNPATDPKAIDEAHDLINTFKTPWPPIEVSQW